LNHLNNLTRGMKCPMANDKREAAAIPPKKGIEKESGTSTPELN
jgi:hypothetical protein